MAYVEDVNNTIGSNIARESVLFLGTSQQRTRLIGLGL